MPEKGQEEFGPKRVLGELAALTAGLALVFGIVTAIVDKNVVSFFVGAGAATVVVLLVCATILLTIAVHECAHLVAGWCTGHRLYLLQVSYFQYVRVGDRIRFQLVDVDPMSGLCGMGLRSTNRQYLRLYVFIIAAPLASIGYAFSLAYYLHFAADAGVLEFLRPVSLFVTLPAIYFSIAPVFNPREGDAGMLEELRRNPCSAPAEGALTYMMWQDYSRHRPRNYSAEHIRVLKSVQPGDRYALGSAWYLWSHYHDAGDFEGMNRVIETMIQSASDMVVDGACEDWSGYGDVYYPVSVIDAMYDIRRTSQTEKAEHVLAQVQDDELMSEWLKYWLDALELAVLGTKKDARRYEAANKLYCDLCPSEFGHDQIEEYVREQIEIWVPDFDDACGD